MFQMQRYRHLGRLYILLAVLFLSGCSELPSGQVIDAETGEPVAGAFVLARYEWDGFPISPDPGAVPKNRCYGSLVTQTDAQGRYDFTTQAANIPTTEMHFRKRVRLVTYAPGYTTGHSASHTYFNAPKGIFVTPALTVAHDNDLLKISKTTEPLQEHRGPYLLNIAAYNICNSATPSHLAFFDAIISDLTSNAKNVSGFASALELCRMKQKTESRMGITTDPEACSSFEQKSQAPRL